MNPEMMILEHLCQVLVFWAVCLVGWATVEIIGRYRIRNEIRNEIRNGIRNEIRNGEGRRAE